MQQKLITESYNKIASVYLNSRDLLKSGKHISQLLKYLPKKSSVLDLGCGAGIPIDDILLKAGHSVVGIDISSKQIELARKYCPRGEYRVGDIAKLVENEYGVDVVVSFYTLFHLPRTLHFQYLKIWRSFLPHHGLLLVTFGDREYEGTHELHGQMIWSSQYGTVKNREMVVNAGFEIISEVLDNSGGERHQVILAKKLAIDLRI